MGASLHLASTSPRRRQLLAEAGVDFRLHPPGEEPRGAGSPDHLAALRARAKATGAPAAPGPILGVDTVVAVDDLELGKPCDRAAAEAMLHRLGGREHRVWTGHCLVLPGSRRCLERLVGARVRFQALDEAARAAFLDSGTWRGKAGGYGIQDPEAWFAELVEGDLDTVIGLHVATVRELLEAAG